MKKDDLNQKNDAGETRRIYRKESLNDTEYDINSKTNTNIYRKKTPIDQTNDFDDPLDDDFNIDHFDFDDADVERFRRLNEEEAETRAEKKANKRSEKDRIKKTNLSEDDEEIIRDAKKKNKKESRKSAGRRRAIDETMVWSISKKRNTNKSILGVTYVMMAMFVCMIGYFIYFDAVGSEEVIYNAHNSRLTTIAEKVTRGSILSADGEILAETLTDEDGNEYRYYPYGSTFAHVVGTSEINKSGIELSADYSLISSDIQPLQKILNEISGTKSEGNSVVTTLNAKLQEIAREALGDKQGAVIAIEPSTGKVLAMISTPDYDPNTLEENYNDIINDDDSKVLLNQATQGLFVPGSIFKIVTTVAYLRSGGSISDYSYTCSGSTLLDTDTGSSYLKCYSGSVHGTLTYTQAFAKSCNSAFANLGLSIDTDVMNEVCNDLLFNQSLPTDFTTSASKFGLSDDDSDWTIGATAIGQGNTVITPLHAAMLVSAIANGGVLMEPYVIDSVVSAEDTTVEKYMPESYGSLLSASEAQTLTELMQEVVDSGTASRLSGKSYDAAGKTGTAEVSGQGDNAWFVGFAPADNPEIALCVLVEDADGSASTEAVPIAEEIFDAYLN